MTQSLSSLDLLLLEIILATLAVGLPVLVVLAARFLWERKVNLGRSKELEKLIWQLHRIASALEHQMSLSFPAVQPGTEEPRDIAYLQQRTVQAPGATAGAASSRAAAPSSANQAVPQQPVTVPAGQQTAGAAPEGSAAPGEAPRGGVNSMFGL